MCIQALKAATLVTHGTSRMLDELLAVGLYSSSVRASFKYLTGEPPETRDDWVGPQFNVCYPWPGVG